jgi:UDP-N-acetylglucosamine 2-epimerase (non-hydrolysing)
MHELDRHANHVMVHTGQNHDYELNEVFFKQLDIRKPDYFLNAAAKTAAMTIGNVIANIETVILKEKPEAFLLLGDTNSCLSAIVAKRHHIPVFHMEAGNRCFDQRVPEEINRKIVDHVSDINLVYTEHARRYLLAEGIRPETIIKTGSPMNEVLTYYRSGIEASDILDSLELSERKFILVSTHREENIDSDKNFTLLLDSLRKIAEKFNFPVIVSTHPRTRQRLDHYKDKNLNKLVRLLKPMGFFDYIKLQMNAFCVVSDSGTITEEASLLNFPAVTIRQAHERPEGMDEGTLIMCGLKPDHVIEAMHTVTAQHDKKNRIFQPVADYCTDNVSKKVLRIIMSYTDYINRTVWFQ